MYEKITLGNGVRIVFEPMDGVRSTAIGIWVGAGSRYERAAENGAAHFIEHMLFKGTDKYTAAELAEQMDGIGGQINAFTTREATCYYARVLDEHLETAFDILSGMFFDSLIAEDDVRNERGVILEEIDMYDDTPDDLCSERLFKGIFKGALGRPVLGTPKTLSAVTGESLRDFKDKNYIAPRIVVTLCGSFNENHIKMIENRFSVMEKKRDVPLRACSYTKTLSAKRKAIEQNHLCIAFPGLRSAHEDRFALQIMSNILGGGMSSRLFQTVRERNGLCYSIYTFLAGFRDTGTFGIEIAMGQETEERALALIRDELLKLLDGGATEAELSRTREQVKSGLILSLESTHARMNKFGNGELMTGRSMSTDELIERYNSVTLDDVRTIAGRSINFDEMSISAVGRVSSGEKYLELLTAR